MLCKEKESSVFRRFFFFNIRYLSKYYKNIAHTCGQVIDCRYFIFAQQLRKKVPVFQQY